MILSFQIGGFQKVHRIHTHPEVKKQVRCALADPASSGDLRLRADGCHCQTRHGHLRWIQASTPFIIAV